MNLFGSLKKHAIVIAIAISMTVLLFLSVNTFIEHLRQYEEQATDHELENISISNTLAMRNTIDSYITTLNAISTTLEEYDDPTDPLVIALLNRLAIQNGFLRLAINYANGLSYTSDGNVLDFSSLGGLERITNAETYIDDVADTLLESEPAIQIHVPMWSKHGKPFASLRAAIRTSDLSKNLDKNLFWDQGGYSVVDGNGRYVASNSLVDNQLSKLNFLVEMSKKAYKPGNAYDDITGAFTNNTKAHTSYMDKGTLMHVHINPLGINNWMMLTMHDESKVAARSGIYVKYAMRMMVQITCILLFVFLYAYITQRKSRETAILNENCFRALAEQTNKAIIEWTFSLRRITSVSNFRETFNREIFTINREQDAISANAIHIQDKDVFIDSFNKITSGQNVAQARFRISDDRGTFHWCEFSGVVVNDRRGKPYKAIWSLENIDGQIKKEESLNKDAQTDNLTGLYNKKTSEFMISEALKTSKNTDLHALICLDLDNFKGVNDTFGHMYGDDVLKEVTQKIKSVFRSSDILGRFGGDEFLFLIRDIPEKDFAKKKAATLNHFIKKTYSVDSKDVTVSASIGIAFFPSDAQIYDELYRKADHASYLAKRSGKDNYIVYEEAEHDNVEAIK